MLDFNLQCQHLIIIRSSAKDLGSIAHFFYTSAFAGLSHAASEPGMIGEMWEGYLLKAKHRARRFSQKLFACPWALLLGLWCCNVRSATSRSFLRRDVNSSKDRETSYLFSYDLDAKPKDAGALPQIVQVIFWFWTTEVLSAKGIYVSAIS